MTVGEKIPTRNPAMLTSSVADRCVLNVPGGRLSDMTELNYLYSLMLEAYIRPGDRHWYQLTIALAQATMDPVDPVTYAPHIVRRPLAIAGGTPRDILIQQATRDQVIPSLATESNAYSGEFPAIEPVLSPIAGGLESVIGPVIDNVEGEAGPATAGITQFDGIHDILFETGSPDASGTLAQRQIVHFLDTGEIVYPR